MSKNRKQKMITPEIMRQAVVGAFTKLDPRYMMKNPVMFVVEIGFVISLVLSFAPGLLAAVGVFGALIAISAALFYRRGKRRLTYA